MYFHLSEYLWSPKLSRNLTATFQLRVRFRVQIEAKSYSLKITITSGQI